MRHLRSLELSQREGDELRARLRKNIVEKQGPDTVTGLCWRHTGTWQDGKGYKKVKWKGRSLYVHRVMFTIHNGPIPEGLILDHKCRDHTCCNPDHLEAVTVKENTLRGNGKWIFEQGYESR